MLRKVWQSQGQRFNCSFNGHVHWVRSARFSPDSRLVVSGSEDKTVRIWDVFTHKCIQTFYEHTAYASPSFPFVPLFLSLDQF